MISFSTILLRLLAALLLGSLVGLEREYRHRNAGLRTNALVAVSTALFTIISAYGFDELLSKQHISLDPTRVASYVVAGIGFLGGGGNYQGEMFELVCFSHEKNLIVHATDTIRTFVGVKSVQFEEREVP